MAAKKRVLDACDDYLTTLKDVRRILVNKKEQVHNWHIECLATKTAGCAIGAVDTSLIIGGIIAAPFTGGLSLGLTIGGATSGVVGGVTSLVGEGIESSKISDFQKEVDFQRSRISRESKRLKKKIEDVVADISNHNWSDNCEFDYAYVDRLGYKACLSAKAVEKSIKGAVALGRVSKNALSAANQICRIVKLSTKTFVVLDVVSTVWETVSVIKEWSTRNPTERDIEGLIAMLDENKYEIQKLRDEIAKDDDD